MHAFPVRFMAEFFANHGMLGFRDRPRWSTIAGGSARYVDALIAPFRERVRLSTPVRSITRHADHVEIARRRPHDGAAGERFDQVVIATHSDQALQMLDDPSAQEAELLGAIPYQRNEAVLHTDCTPAAAPAPGARRRGTSTCCASPSRVSTVTYYMNHLQRLRADRDFCVTLNRTEAIDPREGDPHDLLRPPRVHARGRRRAGSGTATISGFARRTHYCGAYWGWGFHEDGVRSALQACEPFGVRL